MCFVGVEGGWHELQGSGHRAGTPRTLLGCWVKGVRGPDMKSVKDAGAMCALQDLT